MDEGTFRNYFLSYASIDFVWMLLKCIHTNVDIWFSIKRRERNYIFDIWHLLDSPEFVLPFVSLTHTALMS